MTSARPPRTPEPCWSPWAQRTLPASSRVERAGPGERHAMRDTPAPSTGRIHCDGGSRRRHDGVRCAPESIRSRRGGAGLGGAAPGLGPEWVISRCAGIFRVTAGSCSVAVRRSRPPQCGHARTPMANPRCMSPGPSARSRRAPVPSGRGPAAAPRLWARAPGFCRRPLVRAAGRAGPTRHGKRAGYRILLTPESLELGVGDQAEVAEPVEGGRATLAVGGSRQRRSRGPRSGRRGQPPD
jgi:hypothetical protein